LKVKKVKRYEYFYWSKSIRSRKKFGGDGRVQTVDYLIGITPIGEWLGYRLWTGEVQLQQYAEAVIKWLCPDAWKHMVKVSIDWRRQRVVINSLVPPLVDCRSRHWRRQRNTLQSALNQIVERSTWIESIIERAAYRVSLHDQYLAKSKEFRDAAKDARLDPNKYTPDADLRLDEYALELEAEADRLMQHYLEIVNDKLLVFAPPKQRTKFKVEAVSKIERLAKDKRWFEQYRAKVEAA
jgi:hypothetical protein